jgi:hypothetical protein
MHGPTYIFWANLAPFSLQETARGERLKIPVLYFPPATAVTASGAGGQRGELVAALTTSVTYYCAAPPCASLSLYAGAPTAEVPLVLAGWVVPVLPGSRAVSATGLALRNLAPK